MIADIIIPSAIGWFLLGVGVTIVVFGVLGIYLNESREDASPPERR